MIKWFSPYPAEKTMGSEFSLTEKSNASFAAEDTNSSVSESVAGCSSAQPTTRASNQLGQGLVTEPFAVDEELGLRDAEQGLWS